MSNSQLSTYVFNKTSNVRTLLDEKGEIWFVAADVCKALEIINPSRAVSRLDADEQALHTVKGISKGNDAINIINESGLYSLILTSRKAEAKVFKRWVTHEVLPSIRKTGAYLTESAQSACRFAESSAYSYYDLSSKAKELALHLVVSEFCVTHQITKETLIRIKDLKKHVSTSEMARIFKKREAVISEAVEITTHLFRTTGELAFPFKLMSEVISNFEQVEPYFRESANAGWNPYITSLKSQFAIPQRNY